MEIATACSINDTYGAEKKLSSNMIGAMVSLSEEEWLIARAIGYVCLSLLPLVLPIIYDSDVLHVTWCWSSSVQAFYLMYHQLFTANFFYDTEVSSCHMMLVTICPHVPPIFL